MGNYGMAWLLILVMGAGGGYAMWTLMHRVNSKSLKAAAVAGVVMLFVTPAPIPGYEGEFAPAFVVGMFEAFFQIEGRPGTAVMLLGISVLVGTVIGAVVGRRFGSKAIPD